MDTRYKFTTLKYLFYFRVQRWSFLCGCPRDYMRRRGECCPLSFQKCTERAGGLCSMLTPTWWTCTRWDPTTMAWDPKCCILTAQRTQRLDRRCCRWKDTHTQTHKLTWDYIKKNSNHFILKKSLTEALLAMEKLWWMIINLTGECAHCCRNSNSCTKNNLETKI